jgi:hypothetical protein
MGPVLGQQRKLPAPTSMNTSNKTGKLIRHKTAESSFKDNFSQRSILRQGGSVCFVARKKEFIKTRKSLSKNIAWTATSRTREKTVPLRIQTLVFHMHEAEQASALKICSSKLRESLPPSTMTSSASKII